MPRFPIGELLTGKVFGYLDASSSSWTSVLNAAGVISATVDMSQYDNPIDGLAPVLNVRELTRPYRSFIGAIDGNGVLRECGPILQRPWSEDDGTIQITGAGLWSYWAKRILAPVLATNQSLALVTTNYVNTDIGSIAVLIILQSMGFVGGSLPIDLPATVAGTTTRTYPGYNVQAIADALSDLVGVIGGPDIMFIPYFSDNTHIRWRMVTGNEQNPFVSSVAQQTFNYSAPRNNVSGLTTTEDASAMTISDFETGGGQDDTLLIENWTDSTLLGQGWPLLETTNSHSTVTVPSTLTAYAQEATTLGMGAVEQWTLNFNTNEAPLPSSYKVGDFAFLKIRKSKWIPDSTEQGWPVRIVGLAGTQDDSVIAVTFQPTPDAAL